MCMQSLLAAVPAKSSRRRRLWELSHKHHCSIIGTCFEFEELRRLVGRLVKVPGLVSDFELHRCTVMACESRGKVSELLHKALEKRHALTIKRLHGCADSAALLLAWQHAVASADVSATLWAILTHPRCTETLEDTIYGELHMLQHQVGSAQRRDVAAHQALQHENKVLVRELAGAQNRATQDRDQRLNEMRQLRAELEQLRAERIRWQEALGSMQQEVATLRDRIPELEKRERLLVRASTAEAQCLALRAHAEAQEMLAEQWQRKYEAIKALQTNEAPAAEDDDAADLGGKQVLCIGGRPSVIEFYRQLVEGQGGRFSHHDGGMEENIAQLEPSLAAADAVICQAGCINHNAYWRVKDFCKRTGKPCVFLKTTGVSSFQRGLVQLTR